MEQRGTLQSWNDSKGFGFIEPEGGGETVFAHISIMRGDARPKQGDAVLYLADEDDKGRLRATHMRGEGLSIDRASIRRKPRQNDPGKRKTSAPPTAKNPRNNSLPRNRGIQNLPFKLAIWGLLCILPLLGSLMLYRQQGWIAPLAAYFGVSLLSFFMYRSDKRRAQELEQRTPENLLHLSELLGGWPGALVAQQWFRHKTRKASYQIVFWLVIAAHQLFWADRLLFDGRYLAGLLAG